MASNYEKKLIEMQFQLKENQQYMTDTFKDLENWSSEMKVKEENLKTNENTSNDKNLPPVRTLVTKKKKLKKAEKAEKGEKKEQKIKAYDYRKWDKFDVDAACKDIEEEKSSSSSDYTTDEEWEEQQKKSRANWEKERGNLFLKENLFDEAINCYTRAIELDPENAIFPANRAMCLLKQEKYGAAEVDCSLSIKLDPKYVKAYHRRGTARLKLKKFKEAKEDFEQILKLEPFNKTAQQELANIEKEIESLSLVFPINKPLDKRSKKPLKRIQIQEINVDVDPKLEASRNEIKSKIKLNEDEEKMFNLKSDSKIKENLISEVNKIETEIVLNKDEIKVEKKLKDNFEDKKLEKKNIIKTIPLAPTNGFQFRKDWQLLSNNLNDLTSYFKQIQTETYSKLFMNGLESDMISKILLMFKNFIVSETKINIFPYLKSLSDVKRFQTQLMFLSKNEKQIILDLFEHAEKNSNGNLADIDGLKKLYNQ